MKKLTYSVFLFSLILLSASSVIAKDSKTSDLSIHMDQQKKESTNSANVWVNYDLAFPGMLPDNKLYKLKVLRDKISLGLISDPKKKVEYLLLQTDKGILATAILVDKKNIELAKQTALKAENNYTLITYELWRFPKRLDSTLYNKLKTASLKHQEVLSSLAKRVSKEDAKIFQTVIDFSKRNWQTIDEYQKSPNIIK